MFNMIIPKILAAIATFLPLSALAQAWPAKPVRTIVTVSGGVEAAVRALSGKLSESLGQPVIVEAQSGAAGAQGASTVARAAPDGYTIAYATNSAMLIRPWLTKNTPYDTLRDFTPIIQIGEAVANVLVSNSLPVNSFAEFIEYARKNPGKVAYGTGGVGTLQHLTSELVQGMTGIKMVHVPYKTGAQSLQDLVTGRIQLLFAVVVTTMPQVEAGKVKMVAMNMDKRWKGAPNVPTMREVLPGYERPAAWMGYFGPAGLPQPITRRLHAEITKGMNQADMIALFDKLGLGIDLSESPEAFAAQVKVQLAQSGALVKAAGIEPE
jgi:tripartite-type tricarboxylate transporter receptor subunit TctC